jgi:uncharacterized integral membrane protein (TIGR00698 family)
VGFVSAGVAMLETRLLGHPVVEALVVAILIGMLVRTFWILPDSTAPGIRFAAKQLLEIAIVLLGVSVDLPLLVRAGPSLALGVVLIVVLGLTIGYGIGRLAGLPSKLSVLIACGNSICGNSAIAAVAPVIDAEHEHVASSIAFTAILGVIVVVGLPLLIHPLGLNNYQYGVLTGLTVYSVPQVLAAAFQVSTLSGQVGTLVKLVRVLMLGPVVLFFAVRHQHKDVPATDDGVNEVAAETGEETPRFTLTRFIPWFIIGFIALATLRSVGAIPAAMVAPTRVVSVWLTIAAMAALGLGVDVRVLGKVGKPVILTVTALLIVLIILSVTLIHVLDIH